MSQPSPLLTLMLDAARRAGEGLIEDARRLATLDVRAKLGPADVFSEADLRAEETVKQALTSAHPDYGFLGEEGGLIEGADTRHVWIVDPLDGTTNFLTGSPLFAVNVALARDGVVIAGVTHVPLMSETFWAEEGKGAFLNDQPIRISTRTDLEQAVLAVGIPFATKTGHEQFAAEMAALTPKISGMRRLGAGAIDQAWVACGRYDAYWEQSVSPWDMAAGAVIVREAGGLCTGTDGKPLDLMGGTVLAATPAVHGMLVETFAGITA